MKNSKSKVRKIQFLLVSYLMKYGQIELLLPDGIKLDVGVVKENEKGDLEICEDYCYVSTVRDDKKTILDSYNLGLQFSDKNSIICEDEIMGEFGEKIRTFDVV